LPPIAEALNVTDCPTNSEADAGVEVNEGCKSDTVMLTLACVTPPTVALTVAVPGPTLVIKPVGLTVTTAGLLLAHALTPPVTVTPETCAKLPVTLACWVWPSIIEVFVTVTVNEVGVVLLMTVFGPAACDNSRYKGETAAFQMRNSLMLPVNKGSPAN
jgi:hypothetical protein